MNSGTHKNIRWRMMIFLFFISHVSYAYQDAAVIEANKWMDNAEYTQALHIISKGLSRSALSSQNKVDLYWLQGICFLSQDKTESANSSFLKLLALEPTFKPDSQISPKILNAFSEAKNQFSKAGGLNHIYKPKLVPIDDYHQGQNKIVRFAIENLERTDDIARVIIYIRKQGNSAYTSLDLYPDVELKGSYVGSISPNLLNPETDSYAVEYYIEALSTTASRLTGVGNSQLPLSFMVLPEENNNQNHQLVSSGHAFYWPHWLGIGTLIFGGVVLGIVSFSSSPDTSIKVVIKQQ